MPRSLPLQYRVASGVVLRSATCSPSHLRVPYAIQGANSFSAPLRNIATTSGGNQSAPHSCQMVATERRIHCSKGGQTADPHTSLLRPNGVMSLEESPNAGPSASEYLPVELGQKMDGGKYTIIRNLGWGGHSTVWLATTGRQVGRPSLWSPASLTEADVAYRRCRGLQRLLLCSESSDPQRN
ncbi:hypothetical protein OH77DRAFT_1221210 [Trametes cingulata]|nr:hypothetical protein OH77DRAFT_1221210 [Trametes cingulata]